VRMRRRLALLTMIVVAGTTVTARGASGPTDTTTLSIVGTSDLHGQLAALPWLGGYLGNLRAARQRDGGAVVVVDAGDLLQGTLESNLAEGAPVIEAYNALGYAAAALGNHEFDFGPVGPAPVPAEPGDDPRGALKARATQASFAFLAANILEGKTRQPVAWPKVQASQIIDVAGLKVGIVGVTTPSTRTSAMPANIAGLRFLPPAKALAQEARRLRARGATVVVGVAHAGGACARFGDSATVASCDAGSEIFAIARGLPKGSVDVLVAGHTHQGIAHKVAGIPVIESYANGRAFGRVDLTVERKSGRVRAASPKPPRELCKGGTFARCAPGDYEGAPVAADTKIAALIAPAFAAAKKRSAESLGVEVVRPLFPRRGQETALGNLLADLARAARPGTDVAVLNGGSLRAGLPAGPLRYGSFYEAFPFDNGFATLRMPAGYLAMRLARSFERASSLVLLSGVRVRARCEGGHFDVTLTRPDGSPIYDLDPLVVTTSDYLATGGDGFFGREKATIENGVPMREAMVDLLRERGGTLDPGDPRLFDPGKPRIDLPAPVPVRCR
jgi:2',3'-cyclic-nucleotide 2'-phosphodiesterase (5'-nucleotidase family)